MVSFLKRSVIETEDWLRYHPWIRGFVGRYKCFRDAVSAAHDHQSRARAINNLCAAARCLASTKRVHRIVERIHEHVDELDPLQVDWNEWVDDVDAPCVSRGVILKPYIGPQEPGVFFVGFEKEWIKLVRHIDLEKFCKRYTLIVAPSSNPYNLFNFAMAKAYPARLFALVNHDEDLDIVPRIGANYTMFPLYTSHWVNPDSFPIKPFGERTYDLIMVASFGKVKRHHLLFAALRDMPPSFRILLVGQDQEGRTAETIRAEARVYGVADRFDLISNATHGDVAAKLSDARVSVLLSLKEGSAVVVPESLFADTPVALLQDAYNGSRAFINKRTGCFVTESGLGKQLTDFINNAESYAARAWAIDNISCHRSTQRMNELLRDDALEHGQRWTQDIAALTWAPDPQLALGVDVQRLQPEYDDFEKRFGVIVGRNIE